MRLFPHENERVERLLSEMESTPSWPFDEEKDIGFVEQLARQFPSMNLVEEFRQWQAWMLDHESKKKVRPRARFRVWCSKAQEFGRSSRSESISPIAPRAEEHGETSDRLERW